MKKIILLIIYFIFLSTSLTFAQKVHKDFIDGEVYIKIKKEVPLIFDTLHNKVDISSKLSFLLPLMDKYKITKAEASFYFSKSDKLQRTFRIHFGKSELVDLLIAEIKKLKQIEYAEGIPVMRMNYTPNDLNPNNYSGQYGLYNIHAQEAWDVSRGNNQVVVAIIDNAIDIGHPDLSNSIFSSRDVSDNDDDPRPPNSNASWNHGTHTAGIACATSDNNTGIASIGLHCALMAIKVTADGTTTGLFDHAYEGISWAASHGADVISCSFGGPGFSQTNQNIIDDAFSRNSVVVASAGNNNNSVIQYPAGYNHVVAVASIDINDIKSSGKDGSSYGTWVDVAAPGVSIFSTLPNNSYGQLSGTSMAAPLVAGLCGLIVSLNPFLTYDEVVNIVVNSTDNIDAQNPGFIGQLGTGRINAFQAVELAIACNPSISLGSGVYSVPKTESSGTIISANVIYNNSQVIFDAATTVNLLPGFKAFNGSVFRAYIDGCGNKFSSNYSNTKSTEHNISGTKQQKNVLRDLPSSNSLNVFPNPASSTVNLSFTLIQDEKNSVMQVYDMEMRKVKEISLNHLTKGKQKITLNLSSLPSGLYLMILKLSATQLTTKVVLIK
ncbi:hypothetical protein BH10BAC2_BH10BAC2_17850 [soil metagenome]